MRICIDARIIGGAPGGIQQFIQGLAFGLSQLESEGEEYHFLTYDGPQDWLNPYWDARFHRICVGSPPPLSFPKFHLTKMYGATWILNHLFWVLQRFNRIVPASDGRIEAHGIDVMHFTTQRGFLTLVPSIYHPHDLLHLHFPHHLPHWVVAKRDKTYRALCAQAKVVATASSWVKHDLMNQYKVLESKIAVVPLAPPTETYPTPNALDLSRVKGKFGLPDRFIFYPAQTWPHKNHVALLKALAVIRDREGLSIPLVCSGQLNSYFTQIRRTIRSLNLENQFRFIGFVEPLELRCLYLLCRAVVIPSLFEAASFPLWEAFQSGAPVACARTTSLPSQAGSAALIFDPWDVGEIADAVWRLWRDDELCGKLSREGRLKVGAYTWKKTASHFRALYRKLAGRSTGEEDRYLLSQDSF